MLSNWCWRRLMKFSWAGRRSNQSTVREINPEYALKILMVKLTVESESRSVVSDSMRPHGLYSPWNPPGQNTGVGSLSLLQWIFPTQRSRESRIAGGFFTGWDIREAQGHPMWTSTHWKSPRCLQRLRAEEGIRGWEGWMALPMQCTWTWQTLGDGGGQEGLAAVLGPWCCSPWGRKESDTTGRLNNNFN